MRRSVIFLGIHAVLLLIVAGLFYHAAYSRNTSLTAIEDRRRLVSALGLTDLCLFTEARYTRHPSMADIATPFQDYPFSLEHFPSGSLMPPPAVVRK